MRIYIYIFIHGSGSSKPRVVFLIYGARCAAPGLILILRPFLWLVLRETKGTTTQFWSTLTHPFLPLLQSAMSSEVGRGLLKAGFGPYGLLEGCHKLMFFQEATLPEGSSKKPGFPHISHRTHQNVALASPQKRITTGG